MLQLYLQLWGLPSGEDGKTSPSTGGTYPMPEVPSANSFTGWVQPSGTATSPALRRTRVQSLAPQNTKGNQPHLQSTAL